MLFIAEFVTCRADKPPITELPTRKANGCYQQLTDLHMLFATFCSAAVSNDCVSTEGNRQSRGQSEELSQAQGKEHRAPV